MDGEDVDSCDELVELCALRRCEGKVKRLGDVGAFDEEVCGARASR